MSQFSTAASSANPDPTGEQKPIDGVADDLQTGWYYEAKGSRKGPVELVAITRLHADGLITPECRVWHRSFGHDWRKLSQTVILDGSGEPPPLPPELVSSGYAWLLASVPLIGGVI